MDINEKSGWLKMSDYEGYEDAEEYGLQEWDEEEAEYASDWDSEHESDEEEYAENDWIYEEEENLVDDIVRVYNEMVMSGATPEEIAHAMDLVGNYHEAKAI